MATLPLEQPMIRFRPHADPRIFLDTMCWSRGTPLLTCSLADVHPVDALRSMEHLMCACSGMGALLPGSVLGFVTGVIGKGLVAFVVRVGLSGVWELGLVFACLPSGREYPYS